MPKNLQLYDNHGCYVDEHNVIAFTIDSGAEFAPGGSFAPATYSRSFQYWLGVSGFNVLARGIANIECEEILHDLKRNRLLPQLITKKCDMLYGQGPVIYTRQFVDGKYKKVYSDQPQILEWLDGWQRYGLESSYKEVAQACIKNFYYFGDYFIKWRMSLGAKIGKMPIAGLELLENTDCRLATSKQDLIGKIVKYNELSMVAVGKWNSNAYGQYQFYPRLTPSNYTDVKYAGVSHHRSKAVAEIYGVNETFEGSRPYIKGSNDTAGYINSFLKNSLAAKIHIVIPNAWLTSKRTQIQKLCDENKKRQQKNQVLLKYNGIEIGTEFLESLLIEYMQSELRKVSDYLTGCKNQGKAFATISFKNGAGDTEEWKFETVDMKYKEYIDALISYDKRADEALLSAVGLDASISSVSKDGVISKSGADTYYNYLIYLMQLNPYDEVCSEPFNWALQINFPELYAQGYRFGYYRETPQRQEDTPPSDRLNKQQS